MELYKTYKLKKSAEQLNRNVMANHNKLNPNAPPFNPRAQRESVQEIFYNNKGQFSSPFAKFSVIANSSVTITPSSSQSSDPNASSSNASLQSISDYDHFRQNITNSSSVCENINDAAPKDDLIKPNVLFRKSIIPARYANDDNYDTSDSSEHTDWNNLDNDDEKTLVPSRPMTWAEECCGGYMSTDEEVAQAFRNQDLNNDKWKPIDEQDTTTSSDGAFFMIHIGG